MRYSLFHVFASWCGMLVSCWQSLNKMGAGEGVWSVCVGRWYGGGGHEI